MNQHTSFHLMIDPAIGRRLLNICWFLAGLGISTLQMQVLAQAWHIRPQAVMPASMASAWMLGTLIGMRLRLNVRLQGSSLLLFMLLWLAGTRFVSWHITLLPQAPVQLCALALAALMLGTISTAWLSQRPGWSPVGERTRLFRGLISSTAGLVLVWMLPRWSLLIGLVCLLPLLVFDFLPAARCPLPPAGSVLGAWVGRYWNMNGWQPRLQERGLGRNLSFLASRSMAARQYLHLTMLASGTAVILGAVWGAVPTPFAGGLVTTHALGKLGWLFIGQVSILAIAVSCLHAARDVVGFPDRLLPASWRSRALSIALLMLFLMGGSLVMLGLRVLQAPWWLALSLACYTAAAAVWGVLLPRLRPNPSTVLFAHRHLLAAQAQMDYPLLTVELAQEEQVTQLLTTVESLCIALLTPAVGWLIDLLGNVDTALIIVGLLFMLILTLSLLSSALLSGLRHNPLQISPFLWQRRAGQPWESGSSRARVTY